MTRPRDNPFRSEAVDRLDYRFPDGQGDWAEAIGRWREAKWIGRVVGPCGCGKTTFLISLRRRIQTECPGGCLLLRPSPEGGRPARAPAWRALPPLAARLRRGGAVLVDGAGLAGANPLRLLRVLAGGRGRLLASAHDAAERPAWPVVHTCLPDRRLTGTLIATLAPEVGEHVVARILDESADARTALRRLYDHCAGRGP